MTTTAARQFQGWPFKAIRAWGCLLFCALALHARGGEGVALGIIFDTSGSMAEPVRDSNGGVSPKYLIASRAVMAIVERLEKFATNGAAGGRPALQVGLYAFDNGTAKTAVRLGCFDPTALRTWVKNFRSPGGATPLGETLELAMGDLAKSPLEHKHLLVVTDGVNTRGPDPAAVLRRVQRAARPGAETPGVHFVGSDVAAKVFAPLKKLGATVVEAADEKELRAQLEFILEEKILLEKEDPKKP
jgi:transposase-like protein